MSPRDRVWTLVIMWFGKSLAVNRKRHIFQTDKYPWWSVLCKVAQSVMLALVCSSLPPSSWKSFRHKSPIRWKVWGSVLWRMARTKVNMGTFTSLQGGKTIYSCNFNILLKKKSVYTRSWRKFSLVSLAKCSIIYVETAWKAASLFPDSRSLEGVGVEWSYSIRSWLNPGKDLPGQSNPMGKIYVVMGRRGTIT